MQGLTNDQVLKYVIDGGVMERPENCPDVLYKMMCRSWQHRPSSRPSFLCIVNSLLPFSVRPSFHTNAFFHAAEGQDMYRASLSKPNYHCTFDHFGARVVIRKYFRCAGQQRTVDARTPLREGEDDEIGPDDRDGALFAPNAIYMTEDETKRLQAIIGTETQNPLLIR